MKTGCFVQFFLCFKNATSGKQTHFYLFIIYFLVYFYFEELRWCHGLGFFTRFWDFWSWPPWIFIHGTDIVDKGLIVLLFGSFLLFFTVSPSPWKCFCRRPCLRVKPYVRPWLKKNIVKDSYLSFASLQKKRDNFNSTVLSVDQHARVKPENLQFLPLTFENVFLAAYSCGKFMPRYNGQSWVIHCKCFCNATLYDADCKCNKRTWDQR